MKNKLLLFLSSLNYSDNIVLASTMAWLSETAGCLFDNYYDSYHQGIHFPGGDSRNLETGLLTGGTVCGDRHFEEFYFLLHSFDVSIVSTGDTIFSQSAKNLEVPIVVNSDSISHLYKKIFEYMGASLPVNIVVIGSDFGQKLSGLDAYLYPEIYYRRAIGVRDSIADEEFDAL